MIPNLKKILFKINQAMYPSNRKLVFLMWKIKRWKNQPFWLIWNILCQDPLTDQPMRAQKRAFSSNRKKCLLMWKSKSAGLRHGQIKAVSWGDPGKKLVSTNFKSGYFQLISKVATKHSSLLPFFEFIKLAFQFIKKLLWTSTILHELQIKSKTF